MFIKTVLEAAFGFPNVLQIKKAALNHVDNVKSITSNVRFDFVGFTRKVESRELKHVLHSRTAWLTAENWIGDAVYALNVNHYANQRETITNADRIIHLKMSFKDLREVLFPSYEENMILDEEFLLLYDEYSSKNLTCDQPFFFFSRADEARGKKITPSSRERHRGIIGRGHDPRLRRTQNLNLWFQLRTHVLKSYVP